MNLQRSSLAQHKQIIHNTFDRSYILICFLQRMLHQDIDQLPGHGVFQQPRVSFLYFVLPYPFSLFNNAILRQLGGGVSAKDGRHRCKIYSPCHLKHRQPVAL